MQESDLHAAQDLARHVVKQMSLEKAERAGAKEPELFLKEKLLTDMEQEFLEWKITAKAVGYP